MPEHNALVAVTPQLVSQKDQYQRRMAESRARMQDALAHMREAARELTPAARISAHPTTWIVGGLLFGFALGVLTSRRRR